MHSQFETTNACRLPCAKYARYRCPLKIIDADKTLINLTSQESRQFCVGHQMEATGKIIAGNRFGFAGPQDGD